MLCRRTKQERELGVLGGGKGSFKMGGQGRPLEKVVPEQIPIEGQESWTTCAVISAGGPAGAEFLRVHSRQEASVVGAGRVDSRRWCQRDSQCGQRAEVEGQSRWDLTDH